MRPVRGLRRNLRAEEGLPSSAEAPAVVLSRQLSPAVSRQQKGGHQTGPAIRLHRAAVSLRLLLHLSRRPARPGSAAAASRRPLSNPAAFPGILPSSQEFFRLLPSFDESCHLQRNPAVLRGILPPFQQSCRLPPPSEESCCLVRNPAVFWRIPPSFTAVWMNWILLRNS